MENQAFDSLNQQPKTSVVFNMQGTSYLPFLNLKMVSGFIDSNLITNQKFKFLGYELSQCQKET